MSDAAEQKPREVRYYAQLTEQGLDDENLIMTKARLHSATYGGAAEITELI